HADVRERCRRSACRQFAWQECHKSCAAHMPRTLPEPGCQRRVYVPLRATWGMPRAIDLIGFAIGNQATACEQGRRGRPFLFGEQAMRGLSLFGVVALLTATGALAHDRWGNPNWIANGHFVSPIDGSHCCGINDCIELKSEDVQETHGGYFISKLNETVPFREVQVSRDGQYWRCKKPDGSRRCF